MRGLAPLELPIVTRRTKPTTSFSPGSRPASAAPQALYREVVDKDDDQDQPDRLPLRGSAAPFYPLRRARSCMDHSRAGLDLFPTWRSAKRIGGWGHNLSPSERAENAGSGGFLVILCRAVVIRCLSIIGRGGVSGALILRPFPDLPRIRETSSLRKLRTHSC